MKQYEAVIEIMKDNGGLATLSHLYGNVFKVAGVEWKTKTPFASIRRIVQDTRFFFRIKPGLWGLKDNKKEILNNFNIISPKRDNNFIHSFYQGLLVELGNFKGFNTFVPNQDKNKKFINKKLNDITSLKNIYEFTYPKVLKYARTVDTIWFNSRSFPNSLFEVEHTTPMENSLSKFVELQDFNIEFYIVADKVREKKFDEVIQRSMFSSIRHRVKYWNYDFLSNYHSKAYELYLLETEYLK